MNENEILDDFPIDGNHALSDGLIEAVVACANYARVFVIVSIVYDVLRFFINYRVIIQFSDDINDIYGSLFMYGLQSLVFALISLLSLYFLWQFSNKALAMGIDRDHEFVSVLKSLKLYFVTSLLVTIFFKILQFLGPYLGQFISF